MTTTADGPGAGPGFPPEEHEVRIRRVRDAMDERGLGTLLLTSPEDLYYLVGLNHHGYFAFTALLLPIEGRPVLVLRAMERPTVELQAPDCVFVPYEDVEDPADAVLDGLRRSGAAGARAGVDGSTMNVPIDVWERIRAGDPGLEWVNASELVRRMRMVKSPAEVELVRAAAAISDGAMQAGLSAAGEGVSEREVAAAVCHELVAAGSDVPGFPPMVRSTPSLKLEHVTWSDRRLERGDTLFIELSGAVARYHAPLTRIVHVGDEPAGLDAVAAQSLGGLAAVTGALKPGATGGEVYDAWQEAVNRALGHSDYRRHHCGYITGIGFPPSWSDSGTPPTGLRRGTDLTVREGMVFHIFSWILGQGPVDYGVSDTVVVTGDGAELLTTTARQPTILRRNVSTTP
jgi:Xaa-Pro dipeptidase